MKKQLTLLIALLFATLGAWAQPTTRNVPGVYTTIRAAINDAVDGDIIQIAAGTYTEALTVGKSLTFIGSGPAANPTTIITSTAGRVIQLTVTGKSFTFQNLIVEGINTNIGIYAAGSIDINSLTMQDVIARNCKVALYLAEYWPGDDPLTTTVSNLSMDNVTLTNNKFIGAYIGKTVLSGTVTNCTVTDNGYSNESAVSWQKTGLQFVNFDEASVPHVLVTNSTFSNNGAGASNIERTGLIIYTAYNALSTSEIMTVSDCSFSNHPLYAVRIKNGYNVGNTATVNGTFSGNYLDIWFNNIIGTTSSTTLVRNTFDGIKTVGAGATFDYNTIQKAIDASNDGGTVYVAAGTYTESVTLKKSLTLKGAGCGQTIWQGITITGRSLLIQRNNTTPANIHVEISGFSFETENNQTIRGDWSSSYSEALTLDIHNNCFAHVNTRNPGNDFALYVDGANQTARSTQGAIRVYDNTFNVTGGVLFEYCRAVDVTDNEFNVTYEAVTFNSYTNSGTIGDHLVDGNTFNHVGADFAFVMNNWFGKGTYTVLPSTITSNVFTNTGFKYAVLVGVTVSQSSNVEFDINQNSILSGTITLWGDYASQAQIDATCNWWGTNDLFTVGAAVSGNVNNIPYLDNGIDLEPELIGFQPAASCSACPPMNFADIKIVKNKISICHNGKTISVNINALEAHLAHGDCLGSCMKSGLLDPENTIFAGSEFQIYPNPSHGIVNVEFAMEEETRAVITLVDMTGKTIQSVFNNSVEAGEHYRVEVDTHNLTNGIYMVKMITESGFSKIVKLIVN